MVGVVAAQGVKVHGHGCLAHQPAEEFPDQVHIEAPDPVPLEPQVVGQPRAPGEIHHRPGQGLVQRAVGVAVAVDPGLVAHRLGQGLAQGDAHVLHRVVGVDRQVPGRGHGQVESPVAGHLVQHVVQEGHAGGVVRPAAPVQGEGHAHVGLVCGTADLRLALAHESDPSSPAFTRYSAEKAWAVSPSARASTAAIRPSSRAEAALQPIRLLRFWKS